MRRDLNSSKSLRYDDLLGELRKCSLLTGFSAKKRRLVKAPGVCMATHTHVWSIIDCQGIPATSRCSGSQLGDYSLLWCGCIEKKLVPTLFCQFARAVCILDGELYRGWNWKAGITVLGKYWLSGRGFRNGNARSWGVHGKFTRVVINLGGFRDLCKLTILLNFVYKC